MSDVTTNEPSVETRRQIAEDLMAPAIGKVTPMVWREMVADTEAALKERDERAAKIAESETDGLLALAKEYRENDQRRWEEDCHRAIPIIRDITTAIRKE